MAAYGHDFSEWVTLTPATETIDGEEMRVCKNDKSHVEKQPIPSTRSLMVFTLINDETEYSVGAKAESRAKLKGTVTIPAYYNSKPVTAISDRGFGGCQNIENIIFEDESLIKNIGVNAFTSCVSLKNIAIPSGITVLNGAMFAACRSLTKIKIPFGVTKIDGVAFASCVSLESIEIPSSVTIIGDGAFFNVTNLTSIEITAAVKTIGKQAFNGCRSLERINFASGSTLESIGDKVFANCSALKEIMLPPSLTAIGFFTFKGCDLLTIYTPLPTKPDGWSDGWNIDNRPVIWDYTGN